MKKKDMSTYHFSSCPSCGCGQCTWIEDLSNESRAIYLEAQEACDKLLAEKYVAIERTPESGGFSISFQRKKK